MILEIILIVLSFVFAFIGLAGVILPFVPGIPMVWLGLLIFGFATNFLILNLKTILIFLLFSVLVSVLDWILPLIGASSYKASKEGIIGFVAGSFLGLFMGGPLGVILGAIMGLVFGEMYKNRKAEEIRGALQGFLIGFFVNGFLKIVLAVTMFVYLIVAFFKI